MDDQTLLRYSRHLLLPEIGIEGQQRIGQARVLLVGAGGLGCPAAIYLAAAGIGTLVLMDDDVVELSNLQRQILHATRCIGQAKVDSAAAALHALNPLARVQTRAQRATAQNLPHLLQNVDLALDCTDNRATRYALNRAARMARIPLVSGGASSFSGQLAVFDFREPNSPCYACLFPEDIGADEACATTGVFAPLAGVVGALQAGEALKLLCGMGEGMGGQLLTIDARTMHFQRMAFGRDPSCRVCGAGPAAA